MSFFVHTLICLDATTIIIKWLQVQIEKKEGKDLGGVEEEEAGEKEGS